MVYCVYPVWWSILFTPFGGYPVWWSIVFTPFGTEQHAGKVANALDLNVADTKRVLDQQDLRYAKVEEDEDEEKTETST